MPVPGRKPGVSRGRESIRPLGRPRRKAGGQLFLPPTRPLAPVVVSKMPQRSRLTRRVQGLRGTIRENGGRWRVPRTPWAGPMWGRIKNFEWITGVGPRNVLGDRIIKPPTPSISAGKNPDRHRRQAILIRSSRLSNRAQGVPLRQSYRKSIGRSIMLIQRDRNPYRQG